MARNYLYSQHFLANPRLVAELIGHSNIRKNDVVYDLGAGSGIISSVLANKCKTVVAVENEPEALKKLRNNLGHLKNVQILEQDLRDVMLPRGKYKVFSNIPFSLSAVVVRKLTSEKQSPVAIYLIVQKQFARKLVPGDDHFTSLLSAQIGPWFSVRIRKPLRKTDFTPPPAVDTVLLEIKLRETPLIESHQKNNYEKFVERCFTDMSHFTAIPKKNDVVSPEKTPSQLTLEQWCILWEIGYTKNNG